MINGIKPKITTPTKLGIKTTSFDSAMNEFCTKLTENVKPEVDKFNHMHSVTFGVGGGRKYIRVEQFQTNVDTNHETGVKTLVGGERGSIHCFVEKTTGDIFKPAGWKSPYLKGNNAVRGNIYDASTFEKKIDKSEQFLFNVIKTLIRRIDQGVIKIEGMKDE